jgi:serine/threonine protein kinase
MQKKHRATRGMRMKHILMIGQQLLIRLRDLHSLNLVHGDLKPANIMLGKGKLKNTLYLIDFGLTKPESTRNEEVRHIKNLLTTDIELSCASQHLPSREFGLKRYPSLCEYQLPLRLGLKVQKR